MVQLTIKDFIVKDIRFPTSLEKHGSDAMHPDGDYSCAYVILNTEDPKLTGHGLTFTIGKGTEVVVKAVESLMDLVIGVKVNDIINDFASFWRKLSSHSQMRWIGPEKGVIHLALAAVINALWDLWAKMEGKPLWKLIVDMEPEKLVSTIDFRYISDVLTKEEAIEMLKSKRSTVKDREKEIIDKGYPAYTTSIGWIGYDDETRRGLCRDALKQGYKSFKAKVGDSIENDKHRLTLIREEIGYENKLMVDANQVWEVNEAIDWMKQLANFNLLWIEEPTSPDDVVGHASVAKALKPLDIGVATGEQCHNRVIFKQLLQLGAISFCQLDSCRLGGLNEVMAVALMAAKFNIPVCPHAGGVGLCEYVRHICFWDYISVSGSFENRMTEYVDHLHEHFEDPAKCKDGRYVVPKVPGYLVGMKPESMRKYQFPDGEYWQSRRK
ncbi:mitochondrial enolase superfamily member 1 [Tetranychus urticae]|uniref:Mitochondrial enolase superfamily member 1 n=1 Tax=Tetranychus urticae TaxID=32264 RepID=T1KUP9_TETUR|nr:mitochondrial enolase superfamily member 1 [Tetranychus urticae]